MQAGLAILKDIKPSKGYYYLAGLIFVIGVSAVAFFMWTNLMGLTDQLKQVLAPGTSEVILEETGTYTIFHEYRSVYQGQAFSSRGNLSGLRCSLVQKETGRPVSIEGISYSATYERGGRKAEGVWTFEISQPGVYIMTTSYQDNATVPVHILAVGHGFLAKLLKLIFTNIALFFVTMFISGGIVVITDQKRKKAKARLMARYGV